ncbi:hypothetical protein [Actinomyces urinae]|uniref:hypothetical protein n=1 Tax=Actinomyces urinae TaxID=1689268 RepID=UPI0009318C6F|nr:hypothetical protein [Actinomyces urinae]
MSLTAENVRAPAPLIQPEALLSRGTIAVFSFIVSPIILTLLYNSTALLQEGSITGIPLGSPTGQLGVLVVAILIIIIAYLTRWSAIGIVIATTWAGAFALFFLGNSIISSAPTSSTQAMLMWQQLPLQIFVILFTALVVTLAKRRQSKHNNSKPARELGPAVLSVYFIVTLLFALSLIFLVLASSPDTIKPTVLNVPQLMPKLTGSDWLLVLLISLVLMAFTAMAYKSVVAVQLVAWFLLLIPALFLGPLFAILTNKLVTPQDPFMISIGYSMPVLGVFGLIIATCTYSISISTNPGA